MTQQNVLKLLKKKKKWMTEKEISRILKISHAHPSLRRLYNQGKILKREIRTKGNYLLYQYMIK